MPIQIVAFNLPDLVQRGDHRARADHREVAASGGVQAVGRLADAADRPAESEADSRQSAQQRAEVHAEGQHHDQGSDARARHTVSIAVIDTGIGIPKIDHVRIFEDFRQVDSTPRRAYGGTGLGLSICRRSDGDAAGDVEGGEQARARFDVYADAAHHAEEVARDRSCEEMNRWQQKTKANRSCWSSTILPMRVRCTANI